jgi:hypothetical protein
MKLHAERGGAVTKRLHRKHVALCEQRRIAFRFCKGRAIEQPQPSGWSQAQPSRQRVKDLLHFYGMDHFLKTP